MIASQQRVNWSVAAERGVWLAVLAGAVVVSAGGTALAGGTATAPAGTATTRTGEALPPLRFRQISSSSDLREALADSTTATSKPLGTG